MIDGSTVADGFDGSILRGVLDDVRRWLSTYILFTEESDADILTLWIAHTYVARETYTTPRIVVDSTTYGAGKTTVIEHCARLAHKPIQAASISSPALLPRMLDKEIRTILIDEVDRSLDPKKPGVEDLIAIINSGYKRGATRPVLVKVKGDEWDVAEMPTFSPVLMAGNAPQLPDDTRSRSIRILLMPDLFGQVEATDWEEIEPEALELAEALSAQMDAARDSVRTIRPELPEACTGRIKEKWAPLARVAAVAGGDWPGTVWELIHRGIREQEIEREEGLLNRPPALILLADLFQVWKPHVGDFAQSATLIDRLVDHNPDYWGEYSPYGRRLTPQRFGRMLVQAYKIHSEKNGSDDRGYFRERFAKAWRQLGITTPIEPSKPSESVELSTADPGYCVGCGGVAPCHKEHTGFELVRLEVNR
ncbi:DUF3631 domain-containing protein [Agromyces sp. NPDC057679]|uniref:DUF3631 domain-containing protein n=1 Tax=Agromyces sp. NPDC057679 TaxID=3346207 RepID=UPI00366C63FB